MSENKRSVVRRTKGPPKTESLQLGDVVQIGDNELLVGYVRFIGTTSFAEGVWIGIHCQKAYGKNDGSVQGVRYFECPPKYGLFARETNLRRLQDGEGKFPREPRQKPTKEEPGETAKKNVKQVVNLPPVSNGTKTSLELGQIVQIADKFAGEVKFIGSTNFADGEWVGIQCDEDGTVRQKDGQRCFGNLSQYWLFAAAPNLPQERAPGAETMDSKIQKELEEAVGSKDLVKLREILPKASTAGVSRPEVIQDAWKLWNAEYCRLKEAEAKLKEQIDTMAKMMKEEEAAKKIQAAQQGIEQPAQDEDSGQTEAGAGEAGAEGGSAHRMTTSVSPTPGDPVKQLKKDVQSIRISLEKGDKVNISAIQEVLTRHQSLAGRAILDNGIMRDLCLEMFKDYQPIMDYVAKRHPNVVEETLRDILEAASSCLHEKKHAVWKQTGDMPNLMQTLEDIFATVVNSSFPPEINYTIWTNISVAEVVKKSVNSHIEDIRIPNYLDIKEPSWKGVSDFVFIPKKTVMNAKENYSYIFLLYKDVEDGLPNKPTNGNEDDDWIVSSFVMSCFLKLDEKPVYDLSPPALLTFKTSSAEDRERQCSYWNFKQSVWLTDGVQEIKSNSSSIHTVCQADHFTSFAILMQHTEIPFSEEDILALSIITYIGCGISTAALIITLIIFLSIESLSSERHKIHTNLVVALLLAHVLFLTGIKETSSQVLCKVIAVFLHYFFLTAFTWMLVEGLHLYLKVVQVFRTENIKMAYYYVFGWCFSIIPVVITLSMKPNSFGNSKVCWLSTEDGTIWAFIGPVIAIIAINCFVLGMVVKTVVSSASAVKSSDHEHVKAGIKGLFVLMPILGVGWVLGLFALNKGTIVFVYAFAIVNGFQGLLIFLLHCVFNSEVRQAFRRQREKHALSKENDSQYNASFSLSQSDSGSKKLSNSNSFEKLKATIPLKRKSTSKVVQVQPVSDSRDFTESSLQVKRTFQDKSPSKLCVTNVQNKTSFLNCPMEAEESVPPLITHSRKQQTTTKRKQSRP